MFFLSQSAFHGQRCFTALHLLSVASMCTLSSAAGFSWTLLLTPHQVTPSIIVCLLSVMAMYWPSTDCSGIIRRGSASISLVTGMWMP